MVKKSLREMEDTENKALDKVINSPVNRTIAGGVIGAGVGLALTPKNRERICIATGLMEQDKSCGEKIKEKAVDLKDAAADKVTPGSNEKDSENDEENDSYQALKSANEELQERLQQLEDKLEKFAESKEKSGKKSGSSKSKIPLVK